MQNQQQAYSQNDCYSTNEQYFLDICRFGQFDQIKEYLSTLNNESNFDWQWCSNSGDNFVHMLSGNNFPDIFLYLINELNQRGLKQKIPSLINKQNSQGNTPLHYAVITQSKQMLNKLLQHGCDPNVVNQFNRTALDQAQLIQKFQIAQILAPLTKQDVEKLKQELGMLDVCNQDDDDSENQDQEQQDNSQEIEDKKV